MASLGNAVGADIGGAHAFADVDGDQNIAIHQTDLGRWTIGHDVFDFAPFIAAVDTNAKKRLIPCAAYCDQEYGVGGYYVGVPVILGANGVEKIVELDLTEQEQSDFQKSVDAVKDLVAKMTELLS